MDRTHDAANTAARRRLTALLARLDAGDLRRDMPGGWTVAATLAHMAFWDARASVLVARWENGTEPSASDYEPADVHWLNDAMKPLCLAIDPREAVRLVLALAEDADAKVAGLSDALLAAARAAGTPFNLFRAEHRGEHVAEIEHALGLGPDPRA